MPGTRTPRRVTLRAVAEASVSQPTVSFVLNEVPNQTIRRATGERVETADAEGHGRLAAREALGLGASDVKVRIGHVISRESA